MTDKRAFTYAAAFTLVNGKTDKVQVYQHRTRIMRENIRLRIKNVFEELICHVIGPFMEISVGKKRTLIELISTNEGLLYNFLRVLPLDMEAVWY
ncbi:hypothetical protein AVEN_216846-1 [Araneus ventricosus]|uniref:Uncharacterized protein n=1 Tax=Araneus ventricosus TaxID=182803 RepID=A0A4Y2UL91_ARAVE|nr:hypothetical protein AVEN_216846-1 [Araneus ventricosus]